jgi:hypothetical protein
MKTFEELKHAIDNNIPLVWNDPHSIYEKNHIISHVDYIENCGDWVNYLPILIQYNEGKSEAEVFLSEISLK